MLADSRPVLLGHVGAASTDGLGGQRPTTDVTVPVVVADLHIERGAGRPGSQGQQLLQGADKSVFQLVEQLRLVQPQLDDLVAGEAGLGQVPVVGTRAAPRGCPGRAVASVRRVSALRGGRVGAGKAARKMCPGSHMDYDRIDFRRPE